MNKQLVALLLIDLLGLLTPVAMANPYVGGHFSASYTTTPKVIFETNYPNTTPSVIPSGHTLQSVLSVVGGKGSSATGYIYQGPIQLWPNGTLNFTPQYFYYGTLEYIIPVHVGTVNTFFVDSEIYVDSNNFVNWKAFVYNTRQEVDYNTPEIFTPLNRGDGDTNLLYGDQSNWCCTANYLQEGVESQSVISSSQWQVKQINFAYYDSSSSTWKYAAGISNEGSVDCILLLSFPNTCDAVGGDDFTGVNTASTGPDSVTWKYTGNSLPAGSTIWSASGTASPYACQVSGRC